MCNKSDQRSSRLTAIIILISIGIVLFWQIMSMRSSRGFDPFELTAAGFVGFQPEFPGYRVIPVQLPYNPTEPNLVGYALVDSETGGSRAFVRLAHGYNMRDCMRYKGYTVDLLEDVRVSTWRNPARVQIWRLQDTLGETSLWMTSVLRAADYTPLETDVRAIPFPSIGVALEPGFQLRGLTRESLRHPVRNFRVFAQASWNNARRDWLTLLRLRRPAWASAEVLTLVSGTLSGPDPVSSSDPIGRRDEILAHHLRMMRALAETNDR